MTAIIIGLTAAVGGAVVGGISSKAAGGSFLKGAATGAAAGAGFGLGGVVGGVAGSVIGGAAGGAVSGGIISKKEGGSFWRGAGYGAAGGVFGGGGAGLATAKASEHIRNKRLALQEQKELEDALNPNYNNTPTSLSITEERANRLRMIQAAENNRSNIISLNPLEGGRATRIPSTLSIA